MEKFKVGDEVVIIDISNYNDLMRAFLKKGKKYIVSGFEGDKLLLSTSNHCQVAVSLNTVGIYQNSKRKELHDKIIKSKFKFSDLSLAIGKSEFYLSNELKESRFNARGDLNNKQYLNLVTSINRGIAILSEDYPPVYESKIANHNTAEIDYKVSQLTEKPKVKERRIHITTVYGIIFILFFAVISLALALFKLLY